MTNSGFGRAGDSRPVIVVVAAVVAALLLGLIGVEVYARHKAASLVADAVQCEIHDTASVSFAAVPPVLWQYLAGRYPDISVQTSGNQIRGAKGMQIDLDTHDIRLDKSAGSNGTIGSITGSITWSSDGIKKSIEDVVPMLGSLVADSVTANPGDGTISLKGLLDSATLKPQIVNNGLSLQVVTLSALGHQLQTDSVQSHLDDLTSMATKDYPLGIHADSVQVTETGVVTKFSAQRASIPADGGSSSDSCFSKV